MKFLKITAAALAAALIFILFACKKSESELMRQKLSREGVSGFVAALGQGSADDCYNVTPDGADGFSVFKFADTGKSYAYSDGKITDLSDKTGGLGYISGTPCGKGKMIYTYSYSDNGKKAFAALYDAGAAEPQTVLTVSDTELYVVKQSSDIRSLPDSYVIYTAIVEEGKNKADTGAALGMALGTVELTENGAEFIPVSASNNKPAQTVGYENVNKIVITSLSGATPGATYTDKERINNTVTFIKDIKTEGTELDNPGEYEGDSIVIGLFYEDGSVSLVYIFGGEYIKYAGGAWYKIVSGGDISRIIS